MGASLRCPRRTRRSTSICRFPSSTISRRTLTRRPTRRRAPRTTCGGCAGSFSRCRPRRRAPPVRSRSRRGRKAAQPRLHLLGCRAEGLLRAGRRPEEPDRRGHRAAQSRRTLRAGEGRRGDRALAPDRRRASPDAARAHTARQPPVPQGRCPRGASRAGGRVGAGYRRRKPRSTPGPLLSEAGRPREAAKRLERWERSDNIETLNAYGIALTDSGQPARALPIFDRALALVPGSVQALQNRGMALLRLNRTAEAKDASGKGPGDQPARSTRLERPGCRPHADGRRRRRDRRLGEVRRAEPEAVRRDLQHRAGRVSKRRHGEGDARRWSASSPTAPKDRYAKDLAEVREARVEKKEQKYFIGLALRTNNRECSSAMPAHKEKFFKENIPAKIPNRIGGDILALYTDYEGDYTGDYSWVLGCEVTSLDEVPKGLVGKVISASKYAVFTTKGAFPQGLIAAWQEIWISN